MLRMPVRGTATVVYYHQVPLADRARFARQMDHLLRWTKPVRADINAPLAPGSRSVAVTFDDGWVSFVQNALPELERRKIPATVFMITDFMGAKIEADSDEQLMSAEQLKSVPDNLVTVGSHTLTHCRLTSVDEDEAKRQLVESRAKLENLLGRKVGLVAFPFTEYNTHLLELSREAGYSRAFTGMPCFAFSCPGEFETGRVRVDPTDSMLEFHLKLMCAYRWMPLAMAAKRRLMSNMRGAAPRTPPGAARPRSA
ncbi:MAG: polysaccharide deacetylase family protein [Candidatus Binataceae bacterium]